MRCLNTLIGTPYSVRLFAPIVLAMICVFKCYVPAISLSGILIIIIRL